MNIAKIVDLEPLSLAPKEDARLLGVSRDHIYDLVNHKKVQSCRSGNRILIDYQSLKDYYEAIKAAAPL